MSDYRAIFRSNKSSSSIEKYKNKLLLKNRVRLIDGSIISPHTHRKDIYAATYPKWKKWQIKSEFSYLSYWPRNKAFISAEVSNAFNVQCKIFPGIFFCVFRIIYIFIAKWNCANKFVYLRIYKEILYPFQRYISTWM